MVSNIILTFLAYICFNNIYILIKNTQRDKIKIMASVIKHLFKPRACFLFVINIILFDSTSAAYNFFIVNFIYCSNFNYFIARIWKNIDFLFYFFLSPKPEDVLYVCFLNCGDIFFNPLIKKIFVRELL